MLFIHQHTSFTVTNRQVIPNKSGRIFWSVAGNLWAGGLIWRQVVFRLLSWWGIRGRCKWGSLQTGRWGRCQNQDWNGQNQARRPQKLKITRNGHKRQKNCLKMAQNCKKKSTLLSNIPESYGSKCQDISFSTHLRTTSLVKILKIRGP